MKWIRELIWLKERKKDNDDKYKQYPNPNKHRFINPWTVPPLDLQLQLISYAYWFLPSPFLFQASVIIATIFQTFNFNHDHAFSSPTPWRS
jgi:hypothetical protein